MDYNNLRWEHLDKKKLALGVSCYTMWLRAVVYPFGLVKTRMQAAASSGQKAYSSTFQALKAIARTEGSRALYQGFWVNSLTVINSPIYLFVLEGTRTLLIRTNAQREWVPADVMDQRISGIVGGLTASLATSTLVVPLGNVTQRQMVHQHGRCERSPSAASVARDIYQKSGVRGFYRGYGASIMTHAPAAAIFWGVYYPTKTQFRSVIGLSMRSSSWWDPQEICVSVAAGAVSAVVSTLLTNPIDVVRVRLQLTDGKQAPTMREMLRNIMSTEGLSGLRRGMAPRMMSMTISVSLASGGYETVKRLAAKPQAMKDFMLQTRA